MNHADVPIHEGCYGRAYPLSFRFLTVCPNFAIPLNNLIPLTSGPTPFNWLIPAPLPVRLMTIWDLYYGSLFLRISIPVTWGGHWYHRGDSAIEISKSVGFCAYNHLVCRYYCGRKYATTLIQYVTPHQVWIYLHSIHKLSITSYQFFAPFGMRSSH